MIIEITSNTNNSKLTIDNSEKDYLNVTIDSVNAKVSHKSFIYKDWIVLKNFFDDLSHNWRGWKGKKKWESIEDDFKISAVFLSNGTISVEICLSKNKGEPDWWEFKSSFILENNQLQSITEQLIRKPLGP